MYKKIAVAFVSLLFLAGCSTGSGTYRDDHMHLADFERDIGDRVFFGYDSAKLSDKAMMTLDHQAEWLKDHDEFSIMVQGHTDERGTKEYNNALGARRAEAVRRHLVEHGIDATRIQTTSFGKERPAVIGNNDAAWSQNRRAVTAIR